MKGSKPVIEKERLALLLWLCIVLASGCGFSGNDFQQSIPFVEIYSDSGDQYICDFTPDTGIVRRLKKMNRLDLARMYTNWDWTEMALPSVSRGDRQIYLHLYDLLNNRMEKQAFDTPFFISDWSKDGRLFLGYKAEDWSAAHKEKIYGIYDARDQEFVPLKLEEDAVEFYYSEFLNNDEIVFHARDTYLYRLNVRSTSPPEIINRAKHSRSNISTSPDNKRIAAIYGEGTDSVVLTQYGILIQRNAIPHEIFELLPLTSPEARWYEGTAITREYAEYAIIYNLFWVTNDELCFTIYDNRSSAYLVFYSLSNGVKAVRKLPELQTNAQNIDTSFLVSKDKRYVFFPTIIQKPSLKSICSTMAKSVVSKGTGSPSLDITYSTISVIDREKNYRMQRVLKRKGVSIFFPEQIVGE
jgi:hypothetical protein